jgi:hypothetical protein
MGLYEIEATIECRSQVLVICNLFGIGCLLWLVGDWGSSHRTAMVIDGKSSCPTFCRGTVSLFCHFAEERRGQSVHSLTSFNRRYRWLVLHKRLPWARRIK